MNTSRTLMKKQNSDEAALKKYTMILPLLDENLDPASAHELRISIAEKNDISERTVRRYVSIYRKKGFDGLKPAERTYNVHTIVKIFKTFLQTAQDDADTGRYQVWSETSHRKKRSHGADISFICH